MRFLLIVLKALLLTSAALAALLFPVMLFGLQGFGGFSLEMAMAVASLYVTHPIAIVLIFLLTLGKIRSRLTARVAAGVVVLNVVLLLAASAMIRIGIYSGDWELPLVIAIPSILFLLHQLIATVTTRAQRNSLKTR